MDAGPEAAPEQLQQLQQSWAVAPVPTEAVGSPGAAPTAFIRLRGLPYQAGEADIRAFFNEFELLQVFICKRNGRSNGEAYVELADAAQTPYAIARLQRALLGPRYIELFEALESDLATARALAVDRLRGYVVRLRGLPFNASPNDVIRFLAGVEVVRGAEGIVFTWTPDGRPTGEAFVELQDEDAQREAMTKHRERMGTRYIEIFTSTKSALVQAIQHNRLVLGLAERKRWLQQAGLPANTATNTGTTTVLVPSSTIPGAMQVAHLLTGPGQRIDDVADSFAGMSLGDGMAMRSGQINLGGSSGHIQVHPGGMTSSGQLVLQQGGGYTTIYNAPGLPQGMQLTAYQPAGTYVNTMPLQQHHTMQAAPALSGQLLQMSQPGSTSSVATTLHLGVGHSLNAAVMMQQQQLQLAATSHQQLQQQHDPAGGSPPQQHYQQPQQQFIAMESSQSSVTSGYGSLPASAEHVARQQLAAGQSYLVPQPGGGYALQTVPVQMRPSATTTIHEYLQLGQTGPGSGGAGPGSGSVMPSGATVVQELGVGGGGGGPRSGGTATYQVQAYGSQGAPQGGPGSGSGGLVPGNLHVLQQ